MSVGLGLEAEAGDKRGRQTVGNSRAMSRELGAVGGAGIELGADLPWKPASSRAGALSMLYQTAPFWLLS